MRTTISIWATLFLLSIAVTFAFANIVEDPVLYLNAADNPAHPDAWENLGTEGGELLAAGKAPELQEGAIKIPALGINEQNMKYYTTTESHQTWGGPPAKNTPLFFEDWTLEFLCRRNGDFFLRSIISQVSRTVQGKASRGFASGSLVVRIWTCLSMPRVGSKVFKPLISNLKKAYGLGSRLSERAASRLWRIKMAKRSVNKLVLNLTKSYR